MKRKNAHRRSKKTKNPHDGSNLDNFLRENGIFEEVEAFAQTSRSHLKPALTEKKSVKKTAMAKRIHTSRAALNRPLDRSNTSVTLATLNSATKALGRKLKIELVPALNAQRQRAWAVTVQPQYNAADDIIPTI